MRHAREELALVLARLQELARALLQRGLRADELRALLLEDPGLLLEVRVCRLELVLDLLPAHPGLAQRGALMLELLVRDP